MTFTEPAHAGPADQYLGQRTLVTQIWYPRARGAARPFPLLLFAPGFLQCPGEYSDLLQAWASAGYVVAAVNFPRTSCHLGTEAYEADLANQPQDMSYVLTRLLALSARPGDSFSGLLDPHEVGAAGQSDGGNTVAALAANTCCTDRRLKAVAVLSGAEWPPMPGRYFPGGAPPMLFTQGSADEINPPWASLQLYRADGADGADGRYYLDLFGASHLIPYEGTNPVERLKPADAGFLDGSCGQPVGADMTLRGSAGTAPDRRPASRADRVRDGAAAARRDRSSGQTGQSAREVPFRHAAPGRCGRGWQCPPDGGQCGRAAGASGG